MKVYKSKTGKWCYSFICGGRRTRRIVGLSRPEAERAMNSAYQRAYVSAKRSKFGLAEPQQNIRFEDFADEFLEVHSKQHKRSWKRDLTSLNVIKPFFKGRFLGEIGPELIEKYLAKRRGEVGPATCNRERSFLVTLFNKAVEWGKIDENPAAKVKKFREPAGRERILTGLEMRRLVEAAGAGLKPVLVIALNTGMRRGEILGLRWQDVNFGQQFILVGDSKSGRSRKIVMNALVIETLKTMARRSADVFGVKDVKTSFHTACQRAKIEGLRFHDLRHTAASKMIEAGADLVTVSRILGHASIQMTMRYCHPRPEHFQRAVDSLAEIFVDESRAESGTKAAIEQGEVISHKPLTRSFRDN